MNFRPRRWAAFLIMPIVGGSLLWLAPEPKKDAVPATTVKRGDFRVIVTSTGELRAPRFVEIQGPSSRSEGGLPLQALGGLGGIFGGMRIVRSGGSSGSDQSYQTKILSIVPEGTLVKKGDSVAELDRSALASNLQRATEALQVSLDQLKQAKLDTTLTLSELRNQIEDLQAGLEEKQLAKEQAVYEAPSIKRQAQLDLDRAERALAKLKAGYDIKQQQAAAKVAAAAAEVSRRQAEVASVNSLMERFSIRAPVDGMVLYKRATNGRPRGVGSPVSTWDPTVAVLPDLHLLESVTYINEIDIAKLAVGQPVRITLDGDPSKRLTGKVAGIANIGERRPNSDAKVFEVVIAVDSTSLSVRPGMTTSNAIETTVIRDALSIPIEAVMSEGDLAYVYKRDGERTVRQQVELGAMSENDIIIRRGLAPGDRVLLTAPPNDHDLPLARLR
jgi:RND family efflux transporter MFP subunit